MFEFKATTHIQAPAEKVWALISNVHDWPSWNPTVVKVTGRPVALGATVTVFPTVPAGKGFPAKVAVLDAPRHLMLRGGAPLKFLFKGERTFRVEPDAGGVRFTMHEVFTGLLANMIKKSIPDLQPSFDETAKALKARAEAS